MTETSTEPTAEPTRTRRRRATPFVIGLLVLALALLAGPTIWVRSSASDHLFTVEDVPRHPVAIVLGAGLAPGGGPSPFLKARLDIAADLYEREKVDAILVSGDNRRSDYDEPTAMRDYLVERGVPTEQVVLDYAGLNSYDTCVRARRVFEVPSAIVVSQGYHVPRVVALCRETGLDVDGVGDETAKQWRGTWDRGARREYPANVKAAWDVITGRDPVLGEVEPGITDALRRASEQR